MGLRSSFGPFFFRSGFVVLPVICTFRLCSLLYKIVLHKPLIAVQASELKISQACFIEGTWFPWQFIKDGGLVSSLEQMT